jgi:5-methylcytosine-specific restriction endonuclease McrA
MSSEQTTSQTDKPKNFKFKRLVSIIIALPKMYRKFKEHRNNLFDELQVKYPKGQKKYAFEYMGKNSTKMVKQGDLLAYCDYRRNEDTNGKKPNFKDNSRAIESLRKDIAPNCWKEKKVDGELYFIYLPELKELITDEIIENTKHKNQGFSKEIINSKMVSSKYKCELTGLPVSEGHLAGDHWISKEGGGESNIENCVILNKILNEKKNKHDPIVWFCKSLLTNFLTICKRAGMDLETVKDKLIGFIQEF